MSVHHRCCDRIQLAWATSKYEFADQWDRLIAGFGINGQTSISLGCKGNRTFTGLSDEEISPKRSVILMALLLVGGTILDMIHKKSAQYFGE